MKYEIKFTNSYKRNRKLIQKRGYDLSLLDNVIIKLANGEKLPDKNKDHELSGNFKGFRECHIKPDWLLIYMIENQILTLTLVSTGSHADLFDL